MTTRTKSKPSALMAVSIPTGPIPIAQQEHWPSSLRRSAGIPWKDQGYTGGDADARRDTTSWAFHQIGLCTVCTAIMEPLFPQPTTIGPATSRDLTDFILTSMTDLTHTALQWRRFLEVSGAPCCSSSPLLEICKSTIKKSPVSTASSETETATSGACRSR